MNDSLDDFQRIKDRLDEEEIKQIRREINREKFEKLKEDSRSFVETHLCD